MRLMFEVFSEFIIKVSSEDLFLLFIFLPLLLIIK